MISRGNKLVKLFSKKLLGDSLEMFQYEYNLLKSRWSHVRAILDNKIIPPYEIEIQPSSVCNLRCKFCVGQKTHEWKKERLLNNNLTEENVSDCIRNILSWRVKLPKYSGKPFIVDTLKISGFVGEPLLNKKAQDITMKLIGAFKKAGRRVVLFTNGIALSKEKIRYGVLNADSIHISLDSGSNRVFEKLRRPVKNAHISYSELIQNIRKLCSLRNRKFPNTEIGVGFVIYPDNHKDVYKVAKEVKAIGVDFIRYKFDITGKSHLVIKEKEKIKSLLEKANKQLGDEKFKVILTKTGDSGTATRKNNKCYAQYFWGTIGADGKMYLCDHNTIKSSPDFGSIKDECLENIWKSYHRKEVQKNIPEICILCSPFASRINPFIGGINKLRKEFGWKNVEKWRSEILMN